MQNRELAADHVRRAQVRVRALDLLFDADSWADVVRESQEALELALKGLLRAYGVDPPRAHDVSDVLLAERERLPEAIRGRLAELASASRDLRRDRELSFYGAEDLTPSAFYEKQDAERAREMARDAVQAIAAVVLE
jgi:HEPN domain-containing protein